MDKFVKEMNDPESGVPVKSLKNFLSTNASTFTGQSYKMLILWAVLTVLVLNSSDYTDN